MSRRYQRGSLCREKRMTGPDIWVFRWRDGTVNRKQQIGTVEQFPTKTKAFKACELLRANINCEGRSPHMCRTGGPLHQARIAEQDAVHSGSYAGYLKTWILPMWNGHSLSDVRTVAVESWLGTLPLANGTRAKLRKPDAPRYSIMRCVGSSSATTRSLSLGSQRSGSECRTC